MASQSLPLPAMIEKILRYNAGRDPERLLLKYRALASNSFSFLRGTCHLYYEHLPEHPVLKNAPPAWICGDLHLENFGTYKADNRLVYFDMNDFDEAVLAPCTWEIVRLLSSILIAAPSLSVNRDDAMALSRRCLHSYADTLACGKARWIDRDAADGLIGDLFRRLVGRKRQEFIESRTTLASRHRVIRTDRGKALPTSEPDKLRIRAWMKEYAETKENPHFFNVIDIARRVAGTGSLGLERFAILIEGKGGIDGHFLLDLKASIPSALGNKTPFIQPHWLSDAVRVAAVGSRMQAVPPAFLEAVNVEGKAFLLKGLQPSQDRVDLQGAAAHPKQLDRLICEFGTIAAWAQLRSSGREGSANADALIAFGHERKQMDTLLEIASHMADQVESDWRTFAKCCKSEIYALIGFSV
jgi:uncharacterized protein (DUF2252 family)